MTVAASKRKHDPSPSVVSDDQDAAEGRLLNRSEADRLPESSQAKRAGHVHSPDPGFNGQRSMLLAGLVFAAAIGWAAWWIFTRGRDLNVDTGTPVSVPAVYDADRAMGYLKRICEFGPRPSGSPAMEKQQAFLEEFFESRGGEVTRQSFEIRHPENGSNVKLTNLIASWGKDRPRRFLFCAHYDTRPYPDRDPKNPRGTFIGANDGASGVAALMEFTHRFDEFPKDLGVDIVLFDGEEFVFRQGRDPYFLGSEYFAAQYIASPPQVGYQAGVLLDMVGDKELQLFYEKNSLRYAPKVTRSIWKKAKSLKATPFISRARHLVQDDHLALNQVAKIPTVDIIDFDYPRPTTRGLSYWHTERDVPEACSGKSLAIVVWVLDHWVHDARFE